MEIILKLTEQEAQALLALMDAGVKAAGLAMAANAAILHQKLQEAAQRAKEEVTIKAEPVKVGD